MSKRFINVIIIEGKNGFFSCKERIYIDNRYLASAEFNFGRAQTLEEIKEIWMICLLEKIEFLIEVLEIQDIKNINKKIVRALEVQSDV